MDVALSNEDITRLLNGRCNIILYQEIHNCSHLDQLLHPYNACVILFESKPSYGHWVCLTRHDNKVEFFNSYGGYPDDSLRKLDKQFARKSNQDQPYLTKLLIDSPYDLYYNEFQFQKRKNEIKTCGRHCVIRIIHKHLDIYNYKDVLDALCNKYECDYDALVTDMTL